MSARVGGRRRPQHEGGGEDEHVAADQDLAHRVRNLVRDATRDLHLLRAHLFRVLE